MEKQIKNIIFFISLCINCFLMSFIHFTPPEKEVVTRVKTETVEDITKLNDWEIFTMSLVEVESNYDSLAVSNKGARGHFQITPIYIKEVNLKNGTDYKISDVTNFEKAWEIFDLMQQTHNEEYDMDKALTLHNGDHVWYKRRVMNVFDEIKKYEDLRYRLLNKIKEQENKPRQGIDENTNN